MRLTPHNVFWLLRQSFLASIDDGCFGIAKGAAYSALLAFFPIAWVYARGNRTIGRKQGKLRMASGSFIERVDDATPRFALAVVDLAQIQYLPLHHLVAGAALALNNIPVAVFLAVLLPPVASQEHLQCRMPCFRNLA